MQCQQSGSITGNILAGDRDFHRLKRQRVLASTRRKGADTTIQPYDADLPRVAEPRIRTADVRTASFRLYSFLYISKPFLLSLTYSSYHDRKFIFLSISRYFNRNN